MPSIPRLSGLLLAPAVPVLLRTRLPLSESRRRLPEAFDYSLGPLGWTGWRSLASQQRNRSVAGRMDGDRLTAVLLGPRMTAWGPVRHPGNPVVSGSLKASAEGSELIGTVDFHSWVRWFFRFWFGAILLFFLPVVLAVLIVDAGRRPTTLVILLALLVMVAFGRAFAALAGRLRDLDGYDLAAALAQAIDAEKVLPE